MKTNDSKDQGHDAFEAWWESLPGATGVEADKDYEADVKGWALMSWQAALATSASALARGEASVGEARGLAWDLRVSGLAGTKMGDRLHRAAALIEAAYPSIADAVSDAASVQKPVATLHDDGHYTFHGAKPDGFNYAGWHMDVYADAPKAATTSGAQDERAAVEELRGQMNYIAAYDPDESEGMNKDRLAGRLRAIIERARKAISDFRAASSVTAPLTNDSQAARDVLAERQRQMSVEGWTPEHDDGHDAGSLAAAGSAYAIAAADKLHPYSQGDADFYRQPPDAWPWHFKWWKPKDPRTALVKAGALILAEIERIDRAQSTNGEQS